MSLKARMEALIKMANDDRVGRFKAVQDNTGSWYLYEGEETKGMGFSTKEEALDFAKFILEQEAKQSRKKGDKYAEPKHNLFSA